MPAGAQNVMELWRPFIEEQAGGTLDDLADKLADQTAFAKFARQVISDLGYGDQLGDDPDNVDENDEEDAEQDGEEQEEPDNQGQDSDGEEDAEGTPEQTQEEQQDAAQAQVSMDDMADQEMGEETELPEGEAPLEPTSRTVEVDAFCSWSACRMNRRSSARAATGLTS